MTAVHFEFLSVHR